MQLLIEDFFKICDETRLQCIMDSTVNMKVQHSLKDAHEEPPFGTYTELYQVAKQAEAYSVFLEIPWDHISNKIGSLTESHYLMQRMIHQRIQSLTFTAPATYLVK